MKSPLPLRSALLAAWLPLVAIGSATAQSPSPSPTTSPTAKPSADPVGLSPASPVNTTVPEDKSGTTVRKEILDKYDKNHDGVLDADERAAFEKDRAARKVERLKKYDKTHDGKLDESERAAMRADREKEKAAADKEKVSPTP